MFKFVFKENAMDKEEEERRMEGPDEEEELRREKEVEGEKRT